MSFHKSAHENTSCRHLSGHKAKLNCLSFSPTGSPSNLLACSGNDSAISLWNAEDGQFETLLCNTNHNQNSFNHTTSIDWHDSGKKICSGHTSGIINIYDVDSKFLLSSFDYHKTSITCLKFNPLGNTLVSGSYDETLRFWDLILQKCDFYYPSYCSPPSCIDFTSDGLMLAVSGYDNVCRIVDNHSRLIAFTIKNKELGKIRKIKFSPNSLYITIINFIGQVFVYDLRSERFIMNINTFKSENDKLSDVTCISNKEEFFVYGYCKDLNEIVKQDILTNKVQSIYSIEHLPRLITVNFILNKIAFVECMSQNKTIFSNIDKK